MIYSKEYNLPITGVYAVEGANQRTFTALYIGDSLFWRKIRSCYGTGVWKPEKPWVDNDVWKNNI